MDEAQRAAVDATQIANTSLVITDRAEFVQALNELDNLLDQAELAVADALAAAHDLRSIAQLSA